MRRRPCFIFLVLAACFWPGVALAQQPEDDQATPPAELITDRPDATESSSTVPPWRVQLEAGVEFTHDDLVDGIAPSGHSGSFDANAVSVPNLLVRVGVAEFAELRLGAPNIAYEHVTGAGSDLITGSLSLGAKFAGALTKSLRVGLIPQVDVHTETGEIGGGLIATSAIDLSEDVGLGINAGITSEVDLLDERQYDGLFTLALGFALTEQLGAFVETFAILPEGDTDLFVNTGATYLITDLVQLDAYLGTQVPEADQIFAGAGISTLF